MKVLVVGAGGIGGYFGGRLAASGVDVVFMARGIQKEALAQKGLTIRSPNGDLHIAKPHLHEDPSRTGPCDIVLLCTKMWGLAESLDAIRPLLSADAAVLPLQNGVEAESIVAARLGGRHAVGATAQISAHIAEPAVIEHKTAGLHNLTFGELDGVPSPRLAAFREACRAAGFESRLSERIEADLWQKFATLTPLAGATAYYRSAIGPILADSEKRRFYEALVDEVCALAHAKEIAGLPEDLATRIVAWALKLPGGTKASMALDLELGNRLELPWLNGAVVRMGEAAGIRTPSHREVVKSLEPFQMGA